MWLSRLLSDALQVESFEHCRRHLEGVEFLDEPLRLDRSVAGSQQLNVFKHYQCELLAQFLGAAWVESGVNTNHTCVLEHALLDKASQAPRLQFVCSEVNCLQVLLCRQHFCKLLCEAVPEFVPLQHKLTQSCFMQYFVSLEIKDVHLVLEHGKTRIYLVQLTQYLLDWRLAESVRKHRLNLSFPKGDLPTLTVFGGGLLRYKITDDGRVSIC
jgi:hypothetical protein